MPSTVCHTSACSTTAAGSATIYNRVFWVAFIANILLVTGNVLTFRFAEFVRFLGGTEEITGRIVSVGLLGSLFWRAFLGQGIDRFGVRKVWMVGCLIYLAGCTLVVTSQRIDAQLYVGRTLFVMGIASMFACSLSHIQNQAPPERRTEIIGTFGTSGFLGMICGAQLGDVIFHVYPEGHRLYDILFGSTLMIGVVHGVMAWWITRGEEHVAPSETPAVHRLMFRYWPPLVLLVTLMMGLGFSVTMVFLTRYATELGLGGIRTFFTAYAAAAFMLRLLARKWSRTTGRHRLIVWGLAGHTIGYYALTFVRADWQFIPAALCCGFGHALLFPSVVSLGAGAFPVQYRGTGTTITLAAVDVGTILTAPLLGWIIDRYGFHPMLFVVSGTIGLAAATYAMITRHILDVDGTIHPPEEAIADPSSPPLPLPVAAGDALAGDALRVER